MDDLLIRRRAILDLVRERHPLTKVSQAIDRLYVIRGTLPRYRIYPFEAPTYHVERLGNRRGPSVARFDVRNLHTLTRNTLVTDKRGNWSLLWSNGKRSKHPPTPGL